MKTISVKIIEPDFSSISVGTRSASLLATIPGISNIRIERENETEALLAYDWDPDATPIGDIDDRLRPLNLMRADWVTPPGARVPPTGQRDPRIDPRLGDLLDPSNGVEGPPWLQVNSVADGVVHYYYKPWNETQPMTLDLWHRKAAGWMVVP